MVPGETEGEQIERCVREKEVRERETSSAREKERKGRKGYNKYFAHELGPNGAELVCHVSELTSQLNGKLTK